jgi:hypothetical protein
MPLGLGDRRVATTAGAKPVTGRVKRRLPQRLEHLPHSLLDHPVDQDAASRRSVGRPLVTITAEKRTDRKPYALTVTSLGDASRRVDSNR